MRNPAVANVLNEQKRKEASDNPWPSTRFIMTCELGKASPALNVTYYGVCVHVSVSATVLVCQCT